MRNETTHCSQISQYAGARASEVRPIYYLGLRNLGLRIGITTTPKHYTVSDRPSSGNREAREDEIGMDVNTMQCTVLKLRYAAGDGDERESRHTSINSKMSLLISICGCFCRRKVSNCIMLPWRLGNVEQT